MKLHALTLLWAAIAVSATRIARRDDPSTWCPVGAEQNGTMAVQAIIERRLPPEFHDIFDLHIDPSLGSTACHDAFNVSKPSPSDRVQIYGSTTVGLSRGLLSYLRQIGGDIYISGPVFDADILHQNINITGEWDACSWAPFRYLFNVVQFSYKSVWWDWPEWEYMIDWMSLHGVNLPLAIGGQEMVWANVYRDFGMSEEDIQQYFSGPAFLSWQRMGNIHSSWGGRTLSFEWMDKQWTLQKQIIARMVALGITPVLPAFNGFVPSTLHQYIGGNNFINASTWSHFPPQYTNDAALDPTWDTFKTVQSAFLNKQSQMYGGWTSHYYSIDLFNELQPANTSVEYLKANTQNVVASLRNIDPEAVWIMQGWLFAHDPEIWNSTTIPALLSGAKDDELIVLDLASEAVPVWNSTQSFFGKQWVWNLLMTYGGNEGMYGSLWRWAKDVINAKNNSSSLVGVGLTPEAFDVNEIVYEMILDAPWQDGVIDVTSWVQSFFKRRYALCLPDVSNGSSDVLNAWGLVASIVYNNTDPTIQGVPKSIVEFVPATTGLVNITGHHPTKLPYRPPDLAKAWDLLITALMKVPSVMEQPAAQYDLVVCTRQVLANLEIKLYEDMLAAWNQTAANASQVREISQTFIEVLGDIDDVASTNENFLLSNWIANARKWSDDPAEQNFLEYQARDQITIWGPAPNTSAPWSLDRYASKSWSGLVDNFYTPSWNFFVDALENSSPSQFNQSIVSAQVRSLELEWVTQLWGADSNDTWYVRGEAPLALADKMRTKWQKWLGIAN